MSISICCKKLQSSLLLRNSSTHFHLLIKFAPINTIRSFSIESVSSIAAAHSGNNHDYNEKEPSFTVSYLMHSCGLSLESAVSASKYVNFTSPEKPDSVLGLLRDHGFTNIHISKLIKSRPSLLLANPQEILLPKIQFLQSIGVSRSDLPGIVSQHSSLLVASLEKSLIPTYNALTTFVNVDDVIVNVLKKSSWNFVNNFHKNASANALVLRRHGVSQAVLTQLVIRSPSLIARQPDKFSEYVSKAIRSGFSPSTGTFVDAMQAFALLSESTWEHKMEVYRRWGLSNDEICLAFRKHPSFIKASEKKIMSVMGFLVNKMGFQPSDIANLPTTLTYSLEKRIIPRCSVARVLLLKDLIKKEISLSCVLVSSEKWFLDRYVTKYQDQVPHLLNLYLGKISLLELGFSFEQRSGNKLGDSTGIWH